MLLLNLCSQGGVQPARTSLASEALVHQSGRNLTHVLQASLQIFLSALQNKSWQSPLLLKSKTAIMPYLQPLVLQQRHRPRLLRQEQAFYLRELGQSS